jgi:hypothetical protein
MIRELASSAYRRIRKILGLNSFQGSKDYWEQRYSSGGNSGAGSYQHLAEYKASFINDFIEIQEVHNMIEWGCGDGNQCAMFQCESYTGLDVSKTIIDHCKQKFQNHEDRNFYLPNEWKGEKKDLAISLDVIFHLVEDEVYENHMQSLFNSSDKFVIIYSCDFEGTDFPQHVRPRNFTSYISTYFPEWILDFKEKNPFPLTERENVNASWSDFYVFKKV